MKLNFSYPDPFIFKLQLFGVLIGFTKHKMWIQYFKAVPHTGGRVFVARISKLPFWWKVPK